jgi:hypothetical protein
MSALASLLAEHEKRTEPGCLQCACGYQWRWDGAANPSDEHRAHVAAAIAARLAEREDDAGITPGGNPICSVCGKWNLLGHYCAPSERGGEVGALAEVERRIEAQRIQPPVASSGSWVNATLDLCLRIVAEVGAEYDEDYGPGCDCTELCSMGPTCPGGMLAGLEGSGCWRTDSAQQPPDPLAEGARAVVAARDTQRQSGRWRDQSALYAEIEARRALLLAREQQADGGEVGGS